MRKAPELPAEFKAKIERLNAEQPPIPDGYIRQERRYRLITPLFGGGVEPGVADPVTIIRGTSIRGQLRFWWRATRGGQFGGDLAKMKAAEALIWGAASDEHGAGPSKVHVAISQAQRGSDFVATDRNGNRVDIGKPSSLYSYVAFPLQKSRGVVRQDVAFTLSLMHSTEWTSEDIKYQKTHGISIKNLQSEVAAALWAWEIFGGIGARTRRGFGAIDRTDIHNSAQKISAEAWIRGGVKEHIPGSHWPDNVPHLSADMLLCIIDKQVANALNDEIGAWEYLFDALREFRQARTRRFGRSNWPEAEAVRDLTGRRLPKHTAMPTSGKFPRAAFGLPIIYQFKREDQDTGHPPGSGDPPGNNTLIGVDSEGGRYERLASPLILRPFSFGQQIYGLAAVLQGIRLPESLMLEFDEPSLVSGEEMAMVDASLKPPEAAAILSQDKRFKLLGNDTDVLRAFITFLQRRP